MFVRKWGGFVRNLVIVIKTITQNLNLESRALEDYSRVLLIKLKGESDVRTYLKINELSFTSF